LFAGRSFRAAAGRESFKCYSDFQDTRGFASANPIGDKSPLNLFTVREGPLILENGFIHSRAMK
jgi:hypothetical protein